MDIKDKFFEEYMAEHNIRDFNLNNRICLERIMLPSNEKFEDFLADMKSLYLSIWATRTPENFAKVLINYDGEQAIEVFEFVPIEDDIKLLPEYKEIEYEFYMAVSAAVTSDLQGHTLTDKEQELVEYYKSNGL